MESKHLLHGAPSGQKLQLRGTLNRNHRFSVLLAQPHAGVKMHFHPCDLPRPPPYDPEVQKHEPNITWA